MNEVRSPKKPLIFYYIVAMLLVMLFNFIAMPWLSQYQVKDVDYNTFVTMTQQGEVGRVEIQEQDNRIVFTSKDEKSIYKTAMVPDDDLVSRLLEAGIHQSSIDLVHTPIGTPILAVTPEEIAVSIAGEMIQVRAQRRGPTSHGCPMHG